MPIFGSTIGVALGSSGSYNLPTTSSIPGLVFVYTVPTSSNTFVTSSVASIEANIINASQTGSAGELLFRVASPEDNVSKGDVIFKVGATGSNNEPRVGIGFNDTEKPLKAFDIKSKIDNSVGTEILLRSSRTSEGAQTGDEAGLINFVIDSSSFNDITTTGSVATIKSVVDSVSATEGVAGRLIFGIQRNIDTAVDMLEMGYGGGSYADFYRSFTSRSFEIVDFNPTTTATQNASFILSNGTIPYVITRTDNPGTGNQGGLVQVNNKFGTGTIFLHGPTGEITASLVSASGDITSNTFETISTTLASDSATNVDTFNTSSYNGAIYDYILKDTGVGARAGQFMVAHDDGSVTFTDTSTKHLTDSTIPEITAAINSSNVEVKVTNGNGYTFKAFAKKL